MSLRQMTYGLLLLLAAFPAGAQTLRKPLPAPRTVRVPVSPSASASFR